MSAAKKDTTAVNVVRPYRGADYQPSVDRLREVAGGQTPVSKTPNKSTGGIVAGIQPGAHPDPMEENRQEMLRGMQKLGSSIIDVITGRKRNSTNNNISPTTTKDKGY